MAEPNHRDAVTAQLSTILAYHSTTTLCAEFAEVIGPRAPRRRRRKRLAKKIAMRGGMRRTCGVVQEYYSTWPAMRAWGYDIGIMDDLVKNAEQALSKRHHEKLWEFWSCTFR